MLLFRLRPKDKEIMSTFHTSLAYLIAYLDSRNVSSTRVPQLCSPRVACLWDVTYVRNVACLSDSSNVEIDIAGEVEDNSGDMCTVTGALLIGWTSDPTDLILDSRFIIEVAVISIISRVQDGKFESFMFFHGIFANVFLNQFLESPLPVFGFFAANEDKLVRTSPIVVLQFQMHNLLFWKNRTSLWLTLVAKKLENLRLACTHLCL